MTAKRHLHSIIGPGGSLSQKGIPYPSSSKSYKSRRRLQRQPHLSVSFFSEGKEEFSPEQAIIQSWDFLDTSSKVAMCLAHPIFSSVAKLRHEASHLTKEKILDLTKPLDHTIPSESICKTRSRDLAKILLLCDCDVGLFIRVLGGNYTGNFLDFETIDETLDKLKNIPPDPGQPRHDFDLLHKLYHHGVPHEATYRCSRRDTFQRNLYDNHDAAKPHLHDILPKVATDIQKSYAIALPRWMFRFLNGVFISAIGWATRMKNGKTKGRQVNDPSALVTGPHDTGALNSYIDVERDCPTVFYQTALDRILIRVYNLRAANPYIDIIVYKDDLVTAFRRVRYHPDISPAHCFVINDFLIIPIGMVFGARDSPGWFCQVSELRAFASQHFSSLGLDIPDHTLIDLVSFEESINFDDSSSPFPIRPTTIDSLNPGITSTSPGPQNTFVDDTVMVELAQHARLAAINSVLAANLFIGNPNRIEGPISEEKFEREFSYINEVLGFVINTRLMTVSYPEDKKRDLLLLLQEKPWQRDQKHRVRSLAKILGKIRNVSQILPLGAYLSIGLQQLLSRYLISNLKRLARYEPTMHLRRMIAKVWNPYRNVRLSPRVCTDMRYLTSLLTTAPVSIWSRPISLVIPRETHFTGFSDACTIGLGGYSTDLNFQWRLKASTIDVESLHINIKEFIALFINVLLSMLSFNDPHTRATTDPRILSQDGWIFHFKSDNVASISWMMYNSRLRDPIINRLTFALAHLIFSYNKTYPSVFQPSHIPGQQNGPADALSRPQLYPTYEQVFTEYPLLESLQPIHLPSRLISLLKDIISGTLTEVQLEQKTTQLLSLERHSLHLIAKDWKSQTPQ